MLQSTDKKSHHLHFGGSKLFVSREKETLSYKYLKCYKGIKLTAMLQTAKLQNNRLWLPIPSTSKVHKYLEKNNQFCFLSKNGSKLSIKNVYVIEHRLKKLHRLHFGGSKLFVSREKEMLSYKYLQCSIRIKLTVMLQTAKLQNNRLWLPIASTSKVHKIPGKTNQFQFF